MTTPQTPKFIHATIHEEAINKVAGFFNATAKDILNELLQNSRRSGATQVDITTQNDQVTVTDNGAGISDPAALLAFGQTGWDDETTQGEHPAGMGLYALARSKQVRIRSQSQDGTTWQVDLTPDHFVGKLDAPVERLISNTNTPGTTITFTSSNEPEQTILDAAGHYPLPVRLNGTLVEQNDFLHNAIHIEVWEGIRIGVYLTYPSANMSRTNFLPYHSLNMSRMNFHGIIVHEPRLPKISGIRTQWFARADVLKCPHLELTLPARREVIENRFMANLRTACRKAIYRAMTLQPEPVDVSKKTQQEAAGMGISLPDAAPVLKPWQPDTARSDYGQPCINSPQKVSEDSIVIDLEATPPDQQTLARAAELSGMATRFMQVNEDLEGFGWYDRLTKVRSMRITVIQAGEDHDLAELRKSNKELETQRPERIVFNLQTENGKGKQADIVLPSDLVFENEEEEYMDSNRPLVTQDSTIGVHELSNLMTNSFFWPSDDSDADSYYTQKKNHEESSEKAALMLLSSKADALKAALTNAVKRHVIYEVPYGIVATIRIKHGQSVELTLEEA